MVHDNTQSLEEKLQQQASSLLAKRFGSIETEVQRLQSSINEFCERLLTYADSNQVSTEEVADLSAHVKQTLNEESDRASSLAVAEAVARSEQEFQRSLAESETQLAELRAQLAASQEAAAFVAVSPADAATPPAGGFDILRNAITDLDRQRTQAEALTTLVSYAARFAPRIVFFVIKSGNAIGWKASGFANGLDEDTVRTLNVPIPSVRLLRESVDQHLTATATAETMNDSAAILGQYGAPRAEHAVTIPLTVRGKAAAVLYADCGTEHGSSINTEALEALLHVTSLVVELLPVRRSAAATSEAQAQPAAKPPVAPPVAPVTPPQAPTPVFYGGLGDEQAAKVETIPPSEQAAQAFASAAPTIQTAPVVTPLAPEYAVPVSFAPAPVQQPAPEPAPEPIHKPIPALTAVPVTTSSGSSEAQKSSGILVTNASEAEVRAHNDARRFARLLVSEIKLYNEAKVSDGRRSHDLYERLKEDIDRSRQMYEKRVPPTVAVKYDYFYDELVHTLAEGDSAKLT